jgi:DNA repair exonuclease SbcCD ATPase subunit
MIAFKSITWRNLLSTGNVPTTVFLDKSNNTLVIGVNGAGKSTILDALTFVLFGKSFRGINLPNLVNSVNEKDLLVEVEFRIGTREYKVERGIKPAIFNIYRNGELIPQDAKKDDYQKVLENQILKMNYKAFTQIVILGSSSFVPFMQLLALDRRTIIEDLLDIEIFSSMNSIVKSTLKDITTELDELKIKLDSTLSKIELQKKYVEEAKKNNTIDIENAKKEYDDNEIQVHTLQQNVILIQQRMGGLLDAIVDEEDIKTKLQQLKGFQSKIESKMKTSQKHFSFYNDNGNCPTCLQEIDPDFKNQAIDTANNQIHECKNGLIQLNDKMTDLSVRLGEINTIQKQIQFQQSEITTINASIIQIQRHMTKLLDKIKTLENKKVLSDDMLQVSEQLIKDLAELTDKRKELIDSKKYYDIAATLLKDNGIKTKIIRQYLPVINKMVNKYLAAMDFFVNFEIDEEFKETIKSRHRDTFRYENFSEGEKMRIDLALLFTWRTIAKLKNSMNTNLLILDEVFDSSLDTAGTEEFMKLLNSLGSDTNIFVISHKGDILVDKFRSVIRFEKVKNFSVITQ